MDCKVADLLACSAYGRIIVVYSLTLGPAWLLGAA
jgi:hypothetical protein